MNSVKFNFTKINIHRMSQAIVNSPGISKQPLMRLDCNLKIWLR